MKVGIMQPYFLPYVGYFQLIYSCDIFVIYDNIKYTKRGWINRNRMLMNGKDRVFTLPLKKASDSLDIVQREISTDSFYSDGLLNFFRENYRRAPNYHEGILLFTQILAFNDVNLFRFIENSLNIIIQYFGLSTKVIKSSELPINHSLASQEIVIALCGALGATDYINLSGGIDLYDKNSFNKSGINLRFIKTSPFEYRQFDNPFIGNLSIIDLIMFNNLELSSNILKERYEIF